MAAFPIQPEQLTNEWFTETLQKAGELGRGNAVTGFDVSYIGDGVGLLGMVIRVKLKYAKSGSRPGRLARLLGGGRDAAGPDTVVIKFSHPVPENRAIAANLNMYEREVKFFNEIAPQVSVPKPKSYFAAMDRESGSNNIVLEDMAGYRAGDQVKGATVEEAKAIIDAIAPLHAKFWGKTDGAQFADMMRIDSSYIEPFMPGVEYTWQNALANFGDVVPADVAARMGDYVAYLRDHMRLMGRRTQTIVHGDVRTDNAMFGDGKPGLAPVVMLDWQAIMISNPCQDLAWMLIASLNADLRRAHEDELVRYYHAAVTKLGVTGYSIEQCFEDYDVALLFQFAYPIIIAGAFDPANERGRALAVEGLRRACLTVQDRNLYRFLPN